MARSRDVDNGRTKEHDIEDQEVIIYDQNETIDSEYSDIRNDENIACSRQKSEKDKERRTRDSSVEEYTSESGSTPPKRYRSSNAQKDKEERSQKIKRSGRKDYDSEYESYRRRGRNEDRRLQDSSRSSSSSWSSEKKYPIAYKDYEWQSKSKRCLKSRSGRSYQLKHSKRRHKDSSDYSSSSESEVKSHCSRQSKFDHKSVSRKDDRKKQYAKSIEASRVRSSRRRSRSPERRSRKKRGKYSSSSTYFDSEESDRADQRRRSKYRKMEISEENRRDKDASPFKYKNLRSPSERYDQQGKQNRRSSRSSSKYIAKPFIDEDLDYEASSLKDEQDLSNNHQYSSKSEEYISSESDYFPIRKELDKSRKKRGSGSASRDGSIKSASRSSSRKHSASDKNAPVSTESEVMPIEQESKSENFLDIPKETVQIKKHGEKESSRSRSPKSRASSKIRSIPKPSDPEFTDNSISPVKSDVNGQDEENEYEMDLTPGRKQNKKTKYRDSISNCRSSRNSKKSTRSRNIKKMAKRLAKDKSLTKKLSKGKDMKLRSTRKIRELQSRRKSKRRSPSSSSSASSSPKGRFDSSSNSSDFSNSSNSSKSSTKTSVSESPSSYTTASSSSVSSSSSTAKKYKRSTKTKDCVKKRPRSPLGRQKSKSPHSKKLHIGHLSKNVHEGHLHEIFGLYGNLTKVDIPCDRGHGQSSKRFAYIEYETVEEADRALLHMNGGYVDGHDITVAPVLPYKQSNAPLNRSPSRHSSKPVPSTSSFRNRGGSDRKKSARAPSHRRSSKRRSRSRSQSSRKRRTHHESSR